MVRGDREIRTVYMPKEDWNKLVDLTDREKKTPKARLGVGVVIARLVKKEYEKVMK
jgi:hypothetical protein